MSPDEFVSALQSVMGGDYRVAIHPRRREAPQFDVFPEPGEDDPSGKPYRVTFSVAPRMLRDIGPEHSVITEFAEASAANLAIQRIRGESAPAWKG